MCNINLKKLQLEDIDRRIQITEISTVVIALNEVYKNSGFSASPVGSALKNLAVTSAGIITKSSNNGLADGVAGAAFDAGSALAPFLAESPGEVSAAAQSLENQVKAYEVLVNQRQEIVNEIQASDQSSSSDWQSYVNEGNAIYKDLRESLGEYREIVEEQQTLSDLVKEAENAAGEEGGKEPLPPEYTEWQQRLAELDFQEIQTLDDIDQAIEDYIEHLEKGEDSVSDPDGDGEPGTACNDPVLPPQAPPAPPVPRRDPLALDLNNDGSIETLSKEDGVFFDLDNSGFAEKTSWLAPSDGFLVLDRNENNRIDGGAELFGTETRLSNGEFADNGYEALAEFDGNDDGSINSEDAIFSDLRIWQDLNRNGVAESNELKALSELGIESIETNYQTNRFIDSNNVEHREESSFTFSDGNSGLTNTLWFDSDRQQTVPVEIYSGEGIEVADEIARLPDAVGYGNAYSLHQAMTLDDTGELKAIVNAFAEEKNAEKRKELVGEILSHWTGKQAVDPSSRGRYIDGQHVAILETFWGQPALQVNPAGQYAQSLKEVYSNLEKSVYAQLMATSHARQTVALLSFSESDGALEVDFSEVSSYFSTLFAMEKPNAQEELADFIDVVGGISPYQGSFSPDFIAIMETSAASLPMEVADSLLSVIRSGNDTLRGSEASEEIKGFDGNDRIEGLAGEDDLRGGAGNDFVYGNSGDDQLHGGDGRDSLYGGSGNDTLSGGSGVNDYLSGGAGNDTYLFRSGDSNTTIHNHDTEEGRNDVLRFSEGIEANDVGATRSGNALVLTVQGTGETITVQNYFSGDGAGGYALDAIEFSDGTVWDVEQLKDRVQQSTGGDDLLYGYSYADTLDGAEGNDQLRGAGGNDRLSGGDGNDRIYGQEGDDVVIGGAGDDRLYGDEGNDQLNGGEGRDYLYGGSGNDTLQGGSGANDYLSGEAGDDSYLFNVGDGNTTIYNWDTGAGRNDVLQLLEGIDPSNVRATRSGTNLLLTVASSGEVITVQSYFNGDAAGGYALDAIEFADGTVWDIDTVKDLVQQSTESADQLYGYADADALNGEGGNDTLYGAGGDDVLDGGDGDDNVQGQEGNDVVSGGAGDDRLYGHDGADTLSGGEGRDYLYGGDDNDDLQGGEGSDNLYGGNGSDILAGGTGNDDLCGDQGDDVYRFSKGDGADSIYDSSGQDRIEFNDVDSTEVVVRREGDHLRITIPSTGDSVLIEHQFNRTDTSAHSTSLETVDFADGVSWSFNDLMAEAVEGTEGDDVINGFTSDEIINGGDGADEIYGHEGADTLLGGAGNDYLEGGEGQDELFGGLGGDQLRGGGAADALHGGEGSDVLYGGDGIDLLAGGTGDDDLRGDQGDDVYRLSKGDGADTIYDEGGQDRIEFTDVASSEVVVRREGDHLRITVPSTGDSVLIERQFDDTGTAVQSTSLETIDFSDGVSWTFNDLMDQAVSGTAGDDLIQGFSQDETINGGDGADEIYGHEGADTILGGVGNDELDGGEGEDSLAGGTGDDLLRGGSAADTLQGGEGADTLYAGDGDDVLLGDAGNDELHGGAGNDALSGGDDADQLFGDSGADTLSGGAGDDVLHGGSGDDTLSGDAGNDILHGDGGLDTLTGGEGNDELYGSGELVGGNGNDVLEGRGTLDGGVGSDRLKGQGSDTLLGGVGNDILIANTDAWQETSNTLEGGAGADQLFGSHGNDTYRFNLGDGQDTLTETPEGEAYSNVAPSQDTLEFGSDISAQDLSFVRSGKDLQINHTNGTDGILIKNWFQEPNDHYKVNRFVFADGTEWTDLDVEEASVTVGTEGADTLLGYRNLNEEVFAGEGNDKVWGREGNDVLHGEAGDDYLDGEAGDDQLLGGAGNDNLVGRAGADSLEGGLGDDTLQGGAGQDTLLGGSGEDSLFGGEGDDQINGGADNDFVEAGAGNDVANGGAGDDQINGGLGDDTLTGGTGNDRYVFAAGSGHDTIDNSHGGSDGVFLTGGATEDRISFTRDGDDLVLLIDEGAEGSLRVVNHFLGGDGAIDWVQPDGGYMISTTQINQRVAAGEAGGDFDSVVSGTSSGEQLVGGNDSNLMQGLAGDDTLFAMGGNDQLEGGAGADQLYGGNGSGSGSGNDILIGGDGNDTLVGEDGDDSLAGGAGNDSYYYKAGQGVDVIDNTGGGSDGVFFLDGLERNRLTYHQDGNDLVILVDGDLEQQVRVTDHFLGGENAISYIQPTDGGNAIMASQLAGLLTAMPGEGGSSGGETGGGSEGGDISGEGDDTGSGTDPGTTPTPELGGDDVLTGGSANDILVGGVGNDTLSGGQGNDRLEGGVGDDTYVFTGGQDVLKETNGADTLRFGAGITFNQVASGLMKSGDDLVLKVSDGPDQVTLTGFFLGGDSVVETTEFETGGQITSDQIFGAFGMSEPTPASSSFQVTEGTSGGDSALAGSADSDLVQGFGGNDSLSGGAGNDQLEGGIGDDSLSGGVGADTLIGGRGNDTYLFSAGDGQDVIDNLGGGIDTLRFEDISFNQVASGLMKSGDSLVLQIGGSSDSVTIQGFFSGGDQAIDQIEFGSGSQISSGQIFGAFGLSNPDPQGSPDYQGIPDQRSFGNLVTGTASADNILGSSDADFVDGGAGDDILVGGLGDDYLMGGEGNDSYQFVSGDGQDTINNLSNGAGDDQLHFASGIDESQLWFSRDGDDLVTSVLGSDDQVRVQDWYSNDDQKLDSIHTDEASITSNQLEQLVTAMASFGDPAAGEVTLTPQEENQVQSAIASSWQPS